MLDWLSADLKQVLVTAGLGSVLGTVWRSLTRPETLALRFIINAAVSLTVGIAIGGAIVQYFKFEGFMAVSAGAICAFLSEEVLKFLTARGAKLRDGKIDTSLRGHDDE